jgi:hypothetical protein
VNLGNTKDSSHSDLQLHEGRQDRVPPHILCRNSQLFSIVALVGIIYFGCMVALLHFLPTGYNPETQAVSDYGVGQYAVLMDSAFLAIGIGTIALVFSLSRLDVSGRLGKMGILSLLVAGVCFFAVGFFPTDMEGVPVTTIGSIHTALSAVVFLANIIAALSLSWAFRHSEPLRPYYMSSMILAIAEVVILIATKTFFDPSSGIRGVVERAFILSFYSWILLTAIRIHRVSKHGS